jgi:hypothetical protein
MSAALHSRYMQVPYIINSTALIASQVLYSQPKSSADFSVAHHTTRVGMVVMAFVAANPDVSGPKTNLPFRPR